MDYEEAHSFVSMFAYLIFKALEALKGEEFVKEFCEKAEAYPVSGLAAILKEANISDICEGIAAILRLAEYPKQMKSLIDEACKGKERLPKEHFIQEFLKKCKETNVSEALDELINIKLNTLNDEENEIMRVMFGRMPQAIFYAQKYNVKVDDAVTQTCLLATLFVAKKIEELSRGSSSSASR